MSRITDISIGGRRLVGCKIGGGSIMHGDSTKYKEVEWLRNLGSAWVDTGVPAVDSVYFRLKYMAESNCGGVIVGNSNDYRFFATGGNLYLDINNSSSGRLVAHGSFALNRVQEVIVGNHYIKDAKGFTYAQTTTKVCQNQANLLLWHPMNAASELCRIYMIDLYDNDELVAQIRPVERIEDGRLGFYDVLSGRFLENEGSGYFLAGDYTGKTY